MILVSTCLFALLLDQLTKQVVLSYLDHKSIYKITNFLNFVKIWNNGISFGIFSEHNFSPIIFICLSLIIIILILYLMSNINPILQGFIIGGAIGNLIDRIIFGKVFDFIDFHINHWHYPAFNIADSLIVISIIIIIFYEIKAYFFNKNNFCNSKNIKK
ncbi:signal peptidase II [Candidatus Aquarickettsia rohweri]|uniref:Lipoprotein signal peptidase n=1 Tax=Candidatus Aquarickettsia rohweri TaxID=2602574 RepID=A0A3R9ZLB7_9RICK|nr:signal peptidase II [Candidatus Aquarickettsia rohweri]